MHVRLWICSLALLVGVAGCAAKKVPPPPLRTLNLGGLKADYRDYRSADVCSLDAAVLERELDSLRVLLAEFLGQTSAGFDGMWGDEHLALLQAAQRELPPALTSAEKVTEALPGCPQLDVPSAPGVTELVRQSRRRIADAPVLLPYVKAKRDLALWKAEQAKAQESLKAERCAKKAKASAPYYAVENEHGDQSFFFCDGTKVQRTVGGGTTTQSDTPNKKINVATYEALLPKVPPGEIHRAPKLPSKVAPKSGEQDAFDLNSPAEP